MCVAIKEMMKPIQREGKYDSFILFYVQKMKH